MSSQRIHREVDDLALRASQGALRPEDLARLNELLESSDEACRALLLSFSLDADLMTHIRAEAAEQRVLKAISVGLEGTDRARRRRHIALMHPRRWALVAGLLVPLAAFAWYSLSSSRIEDTAERVQLLRAPHKVARVASADDAVWQDGASYQTGDLLAQGERLHLRRGTAQVSMVCGADVLMQAPCTVEFASADRIRLDRGKLTAQAATWAKGFVVEAEGLRITDLGTRFAVLAESPGKAEAHVLEGVVRVEPIRPREDANTKSQLVTAGKAVEWNEITGRFDAIPISGNRFAVELPQFHPLRPVSLANTGRGMSVGSRDPRWRISAGHASGGPLPTQAIVGRPAVEYLDNTPNQSQWISVIGGTSRGVAPYSSYTFQTSFDLADVDPATVHLVGQFLVDNRVQEIRLNGKPLDVEPWELFNRDDFQKFHVVEIHEGFARGVNVVEIDVVNGAVQDGSYNPMALRVEWQAFGRDAGE